MYGAQVLEVFIASPSDTKDQRSAIHDAVVRWNETESRHLGVVLLPVMWETHSFPDLSEPAQPVINRQTVDQADIVIATFWTTLGSPTVDAESGTVEEIDRARAADKHVFLYFCDMPVAPLDSDITAIEQLRAYRDRIKKEGLFSSYSSIDELKERLRIDLTRHVRDRVEAGELLADDQDVGDDGSSSPPGIDSAMRALEEVRRELGGYVTMWQSVVETFDGDPSVDTRKTLALEVEQVLREVIRRVATIAPEAPVLDKIPDVARRARDVAGTMLYLDGGVSFRELTDGCVEIVRGAADLAQQKWEPKSESAA